jgi:hypothetical protein
MGEWRYSSIILALDTIIGEGQFHASAALPPMEKATVPIGYKIGWATMPVWTLWSKE